MEHKHTDCWFSLAETFIIGPEKKKSDFLEVSSKMFKFVSLDQIELKCFFLTYKKKKIKEDDEEEMFFLIYCCRAVQWTLRNDKSGLRSYQTLWDLSRKSFRLAPFELIYVMYKPRRRRIVFGVCLAFGFLLDTKGGIDCVKHDKIRPKDSHQSHAHLSNSFFSFLASFQ